MSDINLVNISYLSTLIDESRKTVNIALSQKGKKIPNFY